MVTDRRRPFLAVDIVIIRKDGTFVLVKRLNPPFEGYYALPGGFVEFGETVESAAVREAKEEIGLEVKLTRIVGVYSNPNRDPRGHVVSIVFLADEVGGELRSGSDAREVKALRDVPSKLAFDHQQILEDAFKLLGKK